MRSRRKRFVPIAWLLLIVTVLLVTHHYWHQLFPLQGITLAKIAGYVLIPLILAIAGNHLAAEVIQTRRRKYMWRAFFVALGFAGLFLVMVVEKQIDDKHETELGEQRNNVKTLLSQQIDLRTNVVALKGYLSSQTTPANQPPINLPLTEEKKLKIMNGSDFQQYVTDWSKKLRNFDLTFSNLEDERFATMPSFGQDQAARERYMCSAPL